MTRIQKYGIALLPLKETDIELVRTWRNLPHVKSAMVFQGSITPQKQKIWYSSLTDNDRYYVISVESNSIGVVYVKDINWDNKSGEAGIFIGVKDYIRTIYPVAAVLAMLDLFFIDYDFNELTATVRSDSQRNIDFNRQLGYVVLKSDASTTKFGLDKESYLKSSERMRNLLIKL